MAYADTQNLFSEDAEEILRRAAAERTVRMNGFNRKEYNDVFGKESISDSAIGPATVANRYIKAEKEPSRIIQLGAPAGFKRNGYLWTTDKSKEFSRIIQPNGLRDGYILDPNDFGSGMMSPPGSNNFYQVGKPGIPPEQESKSFFQTMINEAIAGIKESTYLTLTEWPAILRRLIFDKVSSMGTIPDLFSSLWAMGAYAGPIKNWETDLLNDRLEIIINHRYEALGARTYNVREPTPLILWLRKGQKEIIPRKGRPAEFNDLDFTKEGNLARFKLERNDAKGNVLGGVSKGVDNIEYDPFYTESETLKWAIHKEKDVSTSGVEKDLVEFAKSHYVYTKGSAKLEYLGVHEVTGDGISRLTVPPASILGLKQWDPALFAKTATRVLGGYLIMHWPYYGFEKLGEYLHLPEKFRKGVAQSEVDSIFKPTRYIVDRSRG